MRYGGLYASSLCSFHLTMRMLSMQIFDGKENVLRGIFSPAHRVRTCKQARVVAGPRSLILLPFGHLLRRRWQAPFPTFWRGSTLRSKS